MLRFFFFLAPGSASGRSGRSSEIASSGIGGGPDRALGLADAFGAGFAPGLATTASATSTSSVATKISLQAGQRIFLPCAVSGTLSFFWQEVQATFMVKYSMGRPALSTI